MKKESKKTKKCTQCGKKFVPHAPSITDEDMCDECFQSLYKSEIRRCDR